MKTFTKSEKDKALRKLKKLNRTTKKGDKTKFLLVVSKEGFKIVEREGFLERGEISKILRNLRYSRG